MNDDNYLSINDRGLAEVSPTASRDQQMAFIDNFRQAQGQNNQQIADSIHALGSDLEAPYGGLHGPSDYIKSRYQTPQTESRMAGLRTTAQLAALNQLMQNDLAKWKDKYNQESRNYNKRQRAKQNALLSGGSNGGVKTDPTKEYSGKNNSTLGISSAEDQYLPEGMNRLTAVSINGAMTPDGYPAAYLTADNTNVQGDDQIVAGYGVPAMYTNGAEDIFDLFGIMDKAVSKYSPMSFINYLTGNGGA